MSAGSGSISASVGLYASHIVAGDKNEANGTFGDDVHRFQGSVAIGEWNGSALGTTNIGGGAESLFVGAGSFGDAVTPRLWGVPVVSSTETSAGDALVGVFGGGQAIHIVARQGMEVAMSDSHDENFVKDIIVMKATVRMGLPIYRATAFAKITNF